MDAYNNLKYLDQLSQKDLDIWKSGGKGPKLPLVTEINRIYNI